MSNPYKTREGGATVTVFVPYDCGNNCPFCINKEEYETCEGFSLENICQSIKIMDSITPNCDFVFTGGEPLADLKSLQKMIDLLPKSHRIFINTTLPVWDNQSPDDIINFMEHNKEKITCINISRHIVKYVKESPDELIAKLPVPVRINSVLYLDYPKNKIEPFIKRFLSINKPIQFRYDYTETTPENLYDESSDPIFKDLSEICKYVGLEGCRMRCGYQYDYEGLNISYHKTLPYSTIQEADENGVTYDILYDITIKQTGEIRSDWDDTVLDVDAYRNVVFEKYDLREIETI